MIAGPNGAGKTTLYRNELQARHPGLLFVNADDLALSHFGHAALTEAEAREGQRLADGLRRELMATGRSFFTESTFSHPSKIDLLDDARAAGFHVFVYHVNVRDADLAVKRVASRVGKGGHPVPEDRIRARYDRNQALIRDAVLHANSAWVYDNSSLESHHRMALVFRAGHVHAIGGNVPAWARALYRDELQAFTPEQLSAPSHSFAQAAALARAMLGDASRTFVGRAGGEYIGIIIASTALHTLQQVGARTVVAHFSSRLAEPVPVRAGDHARIRYADDGRTASVMILSERATKGSPVDRAKAVAFRTRPRGETLAEHPDLANAYAHLDLFLVAMRDQGHTATREQTADAVTHIAQRIADGHHFSAVFVRSQDARVQWPVDPLERE